MTGRALLCALLALVLTLTVSQNALADGPPPQAVGRIFNKLCAANTDVLPTDLAPFGASEPAYAEAMVTWEVTIALVTTASVVEVQIIDAENAVTVEADLTLPDGTTTTIPAGKLCVCRFSAPRWAQSGFLSVKEIR